jgi:hypothetical protein
MYTFNHLNISWFHLAKHGSFMHPLDHVRAKLGLEVQAEQAQVEATTNLALDQGKPKCI